MVHFRVTIKEMRPGGEMRTLTQDAYCESREQVIEFYGLNEPDIFSYRIEEVGE